MVEMAERSWAEEIEQTDAESCCSDSGTVTEGPNFKNVDEVSSDGMLKLNEEGNEYILLKHRFYLSIGVLSQKCTVIDAYRSLHSAPMERARLETFKIFMDAMATKGEGNPNVVHAWYCGSKDEVHQIMKKGFGVCEMKKDSGSYCFGLHLYPELKACDSIPSVPADADGLRHLLVCRVILGRTEEILPGSIQSGPSSEDFDSGVDNLQSPSKYIIWYPDVKTNILPLYALSIKMDSFTGGAQREPDVMKPTTPWVPFTSLVCLLTKCLPHSTMCLIRRLHTNFLERKITRQQFIFRVRQLVGDKLLVSTIRDFQEKRRAGKFRRANK
ncbi:uncharacterized protein A4U43_C04F10320 [Asparagus officinalis]|uniref:Poly [ADP-ribose] polymerase n=1 Tax=Asparagus officinalis TaxID=4686 RepID=A0A5P1EZS0_ASPOF|nr:probable inactive poly [ADP-ribose] polymerase SRO3 [Asparagus officinalis]XP_020260689.1 probable inactive poly [ADP-ribose] polymerase SRO3 [Asparagus officinalis]ONK71596.1 uncharacterized protein A4U43_C04F10320 [Asparagus officinalis]